MRDEFLRNNTNKKNRMSDLEFEITLTESDEDGDYVPSGSEYEEDETSSDEEVDIMMEGTMSPTD